MQSARFHPVRVPHFTAKYYNRPEDETRICSKIIETCNRSGLLIVNGDGGVGKTTLVSRLFQQDLDDTSSQGLHSTTIVFWMNCFKWQEDFITDEDKQQFDNELIEMAKFYDPEFSSSLSAKIIPYFNERMQSRVLFVFDDLFSASLLRHFFRSQIDGSKISCCAITGDPFRLMELGDFQGVEIENLEALSDDMAYVMFRDFYKMKDKLSQEKLAALAKYCWGLPLIASLINARFVVESCNGSSWETIFSELTKELADLRNYQLDKRRLRSIIRLFEFSFNLLSEAMRHRYYAFLFFDPGMPVSVKDLELFWGDQAAYENITIFTTASLVRTAFTGDEEQFFVHQMLHEAAVDRASREFGFDPESCLELIRLKLLKRELIQTVIDREMLMFEAVRRHRLTITRRFATVLSGANLALMCKEHTSKEEDNGASFLLFLYKAEWPDLDLKRAEDDPLVQFGINNSYRLIRSILLKLQKTVSQNVILQVVNCRSISNQPHHTFLLHVLLDEEEQVQFWERQRLVSFCRRWHDVCLDEIRRSVILSGESGNPLLLPIIQGNINEFTTAMAKLKERTKTDTKGKAYFIEEAIIEASRWGIVAVLEKLSKEVADKSELQVGILLSAGNGHLNVVQFLVGLDPRSVYQENDNGWTPILVAAKFGHLDVVKFIAETDPQTVFHVTNEGLTIAIVAAENGQLNVIEYIAQIDNSLLMKASNSGVVPVLIASQNGYLNVVSLIAALDPASVSKGRGAYNTTPLIAAAGNGHLDVVRFILEIDPKANSHFGSMGETAIIEASQNGHLAVVKFLAEFDPKCVFQAEENRPTALSVAQITRQAHVVEYLLSLQT